MYLWNTCFVTKVTNTHSCYCAFWDVLKSAVDTLFNQLSSRDKLPPNCCCTDSQGLLKRQTGPAHTLAFWTADAVLLSVTEYCVCEQYRFLAT